LDACEVGDRAAVSDLEVGPCGHRHHATGATAPGLDPFLQYL
jgi:hypothetical protein